MSQSNVAAVVGGIVVGLVVAAVVGVGFLGLTIGGDTKTDVTLSATGPNDACELGKATLVRVRHNNHLIWKVENYCPGAQQTVMVGDFRLEGKAPAGNGCTDAGPDYPFDDGDRSLTLEPATVKKDGSIKPSKDSFKLKAKGLPADVNSVKYAFTICLGGAPADPWVLVER